MSLSRDYRRRTRMNRVAAGAFALLFLFAQACPAASLQVSPIRLDFAAEAQTRELWLSNSGDAPLRAQVRVQQWSQADGEDRLEPTRELVATPAIVEIAPGQRQLVRIVRLQPTPSTVERSFRLIVDELPYAAAQAGSGLNFLLRYSVPVFVAPVEAATAPAAATFRYLPAAAGQPPRLEAANPGARHVKLSQLTLLDAAGARTELVPGLLGYVLAGQRMQWPLPLPRAWRSGDSLHARLNDAPDEQTLALVDTGP